MAGLTDLFWHPLDVRAQERSRFLFFTGLAALINLAQTLGLTGAEALFMAELGADYLPAAIIGGSVSTVLSSMVYAARVGVARNDTLFIQMLIGGGCVLAAATGGLAIGLPGMSTFLLCFFFVTQLIFVAHLSTFTTDYFDTVASKRLLPLFMIGMSVGGVIGGLLAAGATGVLGAFSPIAGWAVFLFAAALMLRLGRRSLRSWGPIELEEADETSVEGIQGAVRYVRASPLGRALVVSALGMILALVVARYMWLDAFARRFPDPAELAAFIGLFLAATNLIEIAIEMMITPWLIRNVGVPSANLVHPVLTLFSFCGLAYHYNVVSGAFARMNGEMLENSLALPIRNLLCNAIPMRFRGRVRAFLEGMVVYAGMSIGGVILWALGNPDPFWLAVAGALASLIYLIANLLVRREYLRTLVEELKAGRLDLADLGEEIGGWEASRLADLWEQLLRNEGERPSQSLLKLIPNLAARGILEPLRRAATHASAEVRRSCITTLASTGEQDVVPTLVVGLSDDDSRVRLAALRSVVRLAADELTQERIQQLIQDPDPLVRAEASLRAGAEGVATLETMIASPDAAESIAALTTAPRTLLESAMSRARDSDPSVRAAALEYVARSAADSPIGIEEATSALAHADSRIRRAAVLLLANLEDEASISVLATAISDSSNEVQFAAESVLGSLGDEGADAAEGYLRGQPERTVFCALRIIARSSPDRATAVLHRELRDRVRELWYWAIGYQRLLSGEGLANRFLLAAYADGVERNRRLAFRMLELLESPDIVRNVEKALRFGSLRSRGDALEVLSHLGDRAGVELLVTYHESGPLADRIEVVRKVVAVPEDRSELIAASLASRDRWIRLGAAACDAPEGTTLPEENLMEPLLALKEISLFTNLSLDQLEAVHQITTEVEYLADEVIMREGDRGDQLYLLLEGRVRMFKNYRSLDEMQLNEQSAVSYFGEMAVLDGEPRSASIVTVEKSRMLSLDGNSLRELLMQMPEISFEIFRVLAGRVRAAEGRIAGK
jgi:HEAT repeat protein